MENQNKKLRNLAEIYQQEETKFLDSLQPTDFRNGESFNLAQTIISSINKAYYLNTVKGENSAEFIKKAFENLFREASPASGKATNLANLYLQMRQGESLQELS